MRLGGSVMKPYNSPKERLRHVKELGYSAVCYTDHEVLIDQSHLCDENFCGIFQFRKDFRYLIIELIQGQDGLAVGNIQVEGDFLSGGQGVDHIGNGADAVQTVEAVQRLGGVGHADGHPVTLLDAHGHKTLGGRVDGLHKCLVGGGFALEIVGNGIGILLGGLPQQLIHGQIGVVQGCGGFTVVFCPGSRCG